MRNAHAHARAHTRTHCVVVPLGRASSSLSFFSPLSRPRFLHGFRAIRLSRVVCNLHSFLAPPPAPLPPSRVNARARARARRRRSPLSSSLSPAYLQRFTRSPSKPGTSRSVLSPSGYPSHRVPPTGSTLPSSRRDSVSVSSIFPLSQCPERLNTNAFIVGTTTDVRWVTSPAWAHPRVRKREKEREESKGEERREKEGKRACVSPLFFSFSPPSILSLSLSVPFLQRVLFSLLSLSPSFFIPANYTPPVSLVRLYLLYLSFLAFARTCRKISN